MKNENEKKKNIIQSLLITIVTINLMLGSLLVAREFVVVHSVRPTLAPSNNPTRTEYVMEYKGSDRVNDQYLVEHYQEYEYHYDSKGELLNKKPTLKEEHVRYWLKNN